MLDMFVFGATTLSKMTFSAKTLSIMTFSIMDLIVTFRIKDIELNDTQHKH